MHAPTSPGNRLSRSASVASMASRRLDGRPRLGEHPGHLHRRQRVPRDRREAGRRKRARAAASAAAPSPRSSATCASASRSYTPIHPAAPLRATCPGQLRPRRAARSPRCASSVARWSRKSRIGHDIPRRSDSRSQRSIHSSAASCSPRIAQDHQDHAEHVRQAAERVVRLELGDRRVVAARAPRASARRLRNPALDQGVEEGER